MQFPVILKGVGTGFSKRDLNNLAKLQPYAIDVSGAGGTNINGSFTNTGIFHQIGASNLNVLGVSLINLIVLKSL